MFLKNIIISNLRSIKDTEIKFQKGFNLIIGDNGVGKTYILESISVALGAFLKGIDNVNTKYFTRNQVRYEDELFRQEKYITPIQIYSEVELDNQEYNWSINKGIIKPRDIYKKAEDLSSDSNAILPLLNYQSVSRMWARKREKNDDIFKKDNFSRNDGYIDCLSQESNAELISNWNRIIEKSLLNNDENIDKYKTVRNALEKFMSIMSDSTVVRVLYDEFKKEIIYIEGNKISPIRYLSRGYQSLICMVLEIAYRMAVLNPNLLENVIDKTPGIVLIDELELHLHPKWQWKVVDALKSTFPKVQFIATTYSPIILASCKEKSVISINSNMEISYRKSAYGLQVSDVLVSYQNSNNIALDINKKLIEVDEYIKIRRYDEASKKLDDLAKELGEDSPEIVSRRVILDLEGAVALGG